MSHLVQRFALAACAVLLGACATPPTEPVASAPAPVPELKPGRLIGYLPIAERIDSKAVLPPPPANPAEAATDEALNRAVLRLRDTARWKLAISDADVNFPHAAGVFSCAVGAPKKRRPTCTNCCVVWPAMPGMRVMAPRIITCAIDLLFSTNRLPARQRK